MGKFWIKNMIASDGGAGLTLNGDTIKIAAGGTVTVDGVEVGELGKQHWVFIIEGSVGNLTVERGDVQCGNIEGTVKASGSIRCGNVGGRVKASGRVRCGDVDGDVVAGGSVNCAAVAGSIRASGSVIRR